MQGENKFTRAEANEIRSLLRKKILADRSQQKSIRNRQRKIGFYITDFDTSQKGFGPTDFDRLIQCGIISILDDSSSAPLSAPPPQENPDQASISPHLTDDTIRFCSTPDNAISPITAEMTVSKKPGVYAIYIDIPDRLPEPFCSHLQQRQTRLLYIGKASVSLHDRLINQDLRHTNPSTFFRGIGAVLGYRPPKGSLKGHRNQNNYKFSEEDTGEIIDWINAHISVKTIQMDDRQIEVHEPVTIGTLRPLLNTTHNPDKSPELADLRQECRVIAQH